MDAQAKRCPRDRSGLTGTLDAWVCAMNEGSSGRASPRSDGPRTLAIDVGGTGIKTSVLDGAGRMIVDRVRVATPHPCPPDILLRALAELTGHLPSADRISLGFPGVTRHGRVITAPHFDSKEWQDYPLESALTRRFGKPARVLNDAEVQGLGIITGRGLEVVLTLGTGVGTAVFGNGRPTPHLELAHHPIRRDKTYNEYVGHDARRAVGAKRWNRRVRRMIGIVYSLVHYDVLYLGGGNSANLAIGLPENVKIASNDTGITGGIRLWDDDVWQAIQDREGPVGPDGSTLARVALSGAAPRS